MIREYLGQTKSLIDTSISSIVSGAEASSLHVLSNDTFEQIREFGVRGKGIRGVLTVLGSELWGKERDESLIKAGAAIELLHSGLLIQDDIMDNDIMRRGAPSVFYHYELEGKKSKISQPELFGISMGVCAGDLGIYMPMSIIGAMPIDADLKVKIISLISNEIIKTIEAQMLDVHYGNGMKEPDLEEIKKVYLYKTGRYTFSLPLMIGGLYAGKRLEDLKDIETFGEHLGIVFQLVDDWLGIFADEKDLGKPVGSDIRENKKTCVRQLLFARAKGDDLIYLRSVFGSKVTESEVERVRAMIKEYNINEVIDGMIRDLSQEAGRIAENLPIERKHKTILTSLIEYNQSRLY